MSIKQKFSSIDQSKLTADQKSFLDKIKNVTKNFTDAEMNKKVEQPLDNFIAKAKEKMPEAIKSAPAKATPKSKAKSSQTRKPKRTPMSLAKEIRKEGESWKDAQARASKMMKEDSKDLSKTVETELDKLSKLVKSQKDREKLSGISGTDIKRDASRKAKPRGARKVTHSGETSNQYGTYKNHLGRKYYESRDRHSDRLAPRYPKNAPLLAEGGYLTDPTFGNFQNQVFEDGGNIDAFTLRMVKSNGMQPAEVLKEDANVRYNKGGAVTNERKHVNHDEDYEVRYAKPRPSRTGYRGVRGFELGGTVVTDLAGHTGGGDMGLNSGMPLSGVSGTQYSGLVGETGAMSSGEMFMAGGQVEFVKDFSKKDGIQISEDKAENGKTFYSAVINSYPLHKMIPMNEDKNYVIKRAEKIYSNMLEYKKNEKYELGGGLPSGAEQSYMITESFGNPAQHYARGGGVRTVGNREYSYGRNWTNDHRHVNKGEDHEVKYNRKGKFLGVFNDGGMMNDGNYVVFSNKRNIIIADGFETEKQALDFIYDRGLKYPNETLSIKKLNKGGAVTNERKHVNHDEDYEVRYAKPRPSRKGYKGARKFMAGGSMETPRIYVADLEAYNNGRLVGEWLDLGDYNDADELMDAIQDLLNGWGVEEYAIHDVEYVPRSIYSEYMGKRDFEQLYEMIDLAKEHNLPLEVVEDVVSQYDASAVEEFQGKYDSAVDFAEQLVDDLGGIQNFNDFEYYLDISETDRRLLSQEMADSYVDDIRDEDGGNRLIEEAGLDVEEYEEADSETQEKMLDEAREIVYDEYYNNWYDGLNDPYYFLVEEQGLYDAESFANANFVRVDYEKLADALEQDYTFIEHDGELYVFNIR